MTNPDSTVDTWQKQWADLPRWLRLAVVLTLLVALVLCWTKEARHDYEHHYLPSWRLAMSGSDPWQNAGGSGNAYGPAFNLLAPLAAMHPLLPKYLMVFCWIGLAGWYITFSLGQYGTVTSRSSPGSRGEPRTSFDQFASDQIKVSGTWLWAYFFLNPLFWIEVPIYGHVDILLACLCVAALHVYLSGHPIPAGSMIAVGTLFKFYPAVLFILFALQRRRGDLKLVVSFLAVTSLGMGLAFLMWGPSILEPILWADQRPSKLLSIFRFLRGPFSPTPNLDWLAGPCTLTATIAVIWYCLHNRIALPLASFATLLTLFTFYKVGHVQYLVVLFGLFPYIFVAHCQLFQLHRWLRLSAIFYLSWISIFQWLYYIGGELNPSPWSHLRDLGGLITFPLALWFLITLLRAGRHGSKPI